MALTAAQLQTLDYAFAGQPFVQVGTAATDPLNQAFAAQPFTTTSLAPVGASTSSSFFLMF